MRDATLSDSELALMVDIAQNSPVTMSREKQSRLQRLLDKHFVEPRVGGEEPGSGSYVLTGKGEKTLAERGVGANES
jgi:hypothetical protein